MLSEKGHCKERDEMNNATEIKYKQARVEESVWQNSGETAAGVFRKRKQASVSARFLMANPFVTTEGQFVFCMVPRATLEGLKTHKKVRLGRDKALDIFLEMNIIHVSRTGNNHMAS